MRFSETTLPKTKAIEEAFNYSFANIMAQKDEEVKEVHKHMDNLLEVNLKKLDSMKSKMTADEYKARKENLEKQIGEYKKQAPLLVARELLNAFKTTRLAAAEELLSSSGGAPDHLVAAALLVRCVKSPVDYLDIEKKFGKPIAIVTAEVVHLDTYPVQRHDLVKKMSVDTRKCYMAQLTVCMKQIAEDLPKAALAGHVGVLTKGQEQESFSDLQALWGLDEKLQNNYIAAFNKMTKAANSPFTIYKDASGKPELVDRNNRPAGPRPPKPPSGGDDGSIGGAVF